MEQVLRWVSQTENETLNGSGVDRQRKCMCVIWCVAGYGGVAACTEESGERSLGIRGVTEKWSEFDTLGGADHSKRLKCVAP